MAAAATAPRRGPRVAAAAWALNILGVVVGAWALLEFDPFPTSVIGALAASLAAVGLAAAFPASFALFDGKDRAAGLPALFLVPLVGLVTKAAFTVQLLHLSADLVPAIVGALLGVAGFALWWLRFRGNRRLWPLMLILGAVVACAVYEELDTRLDRAPPRPFKVPVAGEYQTTSLTKGRHTSYYVTLPAWGPQHEPDSVRVSSEVFHNVQPGQDVCVVLHPGALGAPWYTVGLCPGHAG